MMRRIQRLLALLICIVALSACQISASNAAYPWQRFPAKPLYALRNQCYRNALYIIDPETWKVTGRTALPRACSPQIDQDPQGRLWIGLGRSSSFVSILWYGDEKELLGSLFRQEGMLVLSPQGVPEARLHTCKNPIAGVEFTEDKAVVVCSESLNEARIDVFDLTTLKRVDSRWVDGIDRCSRNFWLPPGGGTALIDNYLLLNGLSDSVDANIDIHNSILTLIDIDTMATIHQTYPLQGVKLLDILTHQGKFYGLNHVREEDGVNSASTSLIVIEPGEHMTIERRPLALSDAMRGVIDGGILYILHQGTRSEPTFDPETGEPLGIEIRGEFIPYTDETNWQALSTYNLTTGATELLWQQDVQQPSGYDGPLHPSATDIAVIDGEVILASDSTDQIYRWDPVQKSMTQILALTDAKRLLYE